MCFRRDTSHAPSARLADIAQENGRREGQDGERKRIVRIFSPILSKARIFTAESCRREKQKGGRRRGTRNGTPTEARSATASHTHARDTCVLAAGAWGVWVVGRPRVRRAPGGGFVPNSRRNRRLPTPGGPIAGYYRVPCGFKLSRHVRVPRETSVLSLMVFAPFPPVLLSRLCPSSLGRCI